MAPIHPIGSGFIVGNAQAGVQPVSSGFVIAKAPTGGAFTGLLDTYPTAAFAYSLRKLRAAYAGAAVRIRESGGSTEADIGFDGAGDFDAAAAASHIGGGSGFIVTWYDQSGNGLDVTQSTTTAQPSYSATGYNGFPCVQGLADKLLSRASVAASSLLETQGTVFAALTQVTSATNQHRLFSFAPGAIFAGWIPHDGTLYFDFGSQGGGGRLNFSQPTGWVDNPHIVELYRDSGDTQGIVVDGSSLGTGSRTDDVSGTATWNVLGGDTAGASYFKGFVAELIGWPTDLGSTDRGGARTNINTYYSVF